MARGLSVSIVQCEEMRINVYQCPSWLLGFVDCMSIFFAVHEGNLILPHSTHVLNSCNSFDEAI